MGFATIEVAGKQALEVLHERRLQFAATGEYPFLIGDQENLDRLVEGAGFIEQDPADIICESLDFDTTKWLAQQRDENGLYDFSEEELLGEWPVATPEQSALTLHTNILTGKPKPTVFIGLTKITDPWQLPGSIKFGDFNGCPAPAVHCAFHRDWQQRFGAEIVGTSSDVIECMVARPPQSRQEANDLAREQFWYCEDIVTQGCGSISMLAATLLDSPYWYFWWD